MPVVTYSLLRLGVFLLALLGLWLAGMGSWLLIVVAALVAAALSYVLFGRQRVAAARWLAERRSVDSPRFSRAVLDDAAAEDAIADRLRADEQTGPVVDQAEPVDGQAELAGDQAEPAADQAEPADGGDQIASPRPSSTP